MAGMKIMLDAGARCPEPVDLVLITHSHSDHRKYLSRVKGDPLIVLTEHVPTGKFTMDELYNWTNPPLLTWQKYNTIAYIALPAVHDTPCPVHYCITDGTNYFWYGCDTASIDTSYDEYLRECGWVMVESNYSEMLMNCPRDGAAYQYPDELKNRIRKSHCSNEYITERFKDLPCKLIRGHISENYNSPCFVDAVHREECPVTYDLS